MSIRRRLLVYLLLCAPLVWAVALWFSADAARHEVNELFDTEMIRLARQVQVMLPDREMDGAPTPGPDPAGEAEMRDLTITVRDADGRLLPTDRDGVWLPHRPDARGFVELTIAEEPWRVFYLPAENQRWRIAVGQRAHERDELVWGLVSSQLLPWLLVLPLLLLAMAFAVRKALAPLRALAAELQGRAADTLQPVPADRAPVELQPLVLAMNGLFARIESTLARERRFTADAAHELRTPLAVLRAQWDVLRGAVDPNERRRAETRLGTGLDRMDRLVRQMLAMSRLESTDRLAHSAPVDWTSLVEQVMADVLPLAERRRMELECDWPAKGDPVFPLRGDAELLAALLRNLLDNAVRYAPEGSTVTLRFGPDRLAVENDGPALPRDVVARLGERFHRLHGQTESGSGLGVSIAQRIALLHGLTLRYRARDGGNGVAAVLTAT